VANRAERLTAGSAFAALALGTAGVVFERAGPSVLIAEREEFAAWVRAHRKELTTQSVFFGLGGVPLLLFFTGLRGWLTPPSAVRRGASRADPGLVVLGGGATWVVLNMSGQAMQVAMARAASDGTDDEQVADLGDRIRRLLAQGDPPLAVAVATAGWLGRRERAFPTWLVLLSLATAAVHLVPTALAGASAGEGPRSGEGGTAGGGALAYLPYPVFVAWLVGVGVVGWRRSTQATSVPGRLNRGPPPLEAERFGPVDWEQR
jgi:hypothetical protein